jgi:hypothetical protein
VFFSTEIHNVFFLGHVWVLLLWIVSRLYRRIAY